MSIRNLRGFNFERLEDRRLLAADCCAEVIQCCDIAPAEICIAPAVNCETDLEVVDVEVPIESLNETVCETEGESEMEETITDESELESAEADVVESIEAEVEMVECQTGSDLNAEVGEQSESVSDLRDPVTGTSGYFGEIDEITPTKSMTFTPSETGTVDVVVASSFGDSETLMEINDANGELIAASMTEDLSGFQRLTFNVNENESYNVTVSSDESAEGYFMVTVDFEEVAKSLPVDIHADQIGESATLLDAGNGSIVIKSERETGEDCDAFRFVAPADGEMVLEMTSKSEDHESDAIVSVFNQEGDIIVFGSTNEEVAIRFDTNLGVEYQVLVDSQNDVPTSFALNGTMFANVVEKAEPVDEQLAPVGNGMDDVTNTVEDDALADCGTDMNVTESLLVDEVFEEFGENKLTENDAVPNRLGGHHHHRWLRRM